VGCYLQGQEHNDACIIKILFFIATKLSLMVDNHKPKCPLKILDCCVQGQGQNEH